MPLIVPTTVVFFFALFDDKFALILLLRCLVQGHCTVLLLAVHLVHLDFASVRHLALS